MVRRAKELGYAALALTDECSLAGIVRAHEAALEAELPLIIGSQFSLCRRRPHRPARPHAGRLLPALRTDQPRAARFGERFLRDHPRGLQPLARCTHRPVAAGRGARAGPRALVRRPAPARPIPGLQPRPRPGQRAAAAHAARARRGARLALRGGGRCALPHPQSPTAARWLTAPCA
ncbi:MAG: PHP domain-containing protein [Steroidobacteraceae bacterium]